MTHITTDTIERLTDGLTIETPNGTFKPTRGGNYRYFMVCKVGSKWRVIHKASGLTIRTIEWRYKDGFTTATEAKNFADCLAHLCEHCGVSLKYEELPEPNRLWLSRATEVAHVVAIRGFTIEKAAEQYDLPYESGGLDPLQDLLKKRREDNLRKPLKDLLENKGHLPNVVGDVLDALKTLVDEHKTDDHDDIIDVIVDTVEAFHKELDEEQADVSEVQLELETVWAHAETSDGLIEQAFDHLDGRKPMDEWESREWLNSARGTFTFVYPADASEVA